MSVFSFVVSLPQRAGRAIRTQAGRLAFYHLRRRCRHGAVGVPLADGLILCRTLDSFRLVVSARDESLGVNLIAEGYWEPNVTRVIFRRVRPGMVCVDIGANVGYFTLLMASLVKETGKIYAAEPVPETRRLLERNVQLNGYGARTEVLPIAFGEAGGQVRMVVPRGEPKNAAISDGVFSGGADEALVEVKPLDALALSDIDFMKIDVEGAEMMVWEGMQATLDRSPRVQILMEVNPDRYADPAQVFARIQERFPLRAIDRYGDIFPISIPDLATANSDVMLYLSRR